MLRPEGWQSRLNAVLKEASTREYHPKEWNCARFAHRCAEAVSGRSLPFRWLGSLEASADAVLPRIERRQARRGDVVLAHVPEPSLGICIGPTAAFVSPEGLITIPMSRVTAAWRV